MILVVKNSAFCYNYSMSHKKKILVVDDEETLCAALKTKFEVKEYEVDVCHDGRAALEKMNETPFDVVLLDIVMKNEDGYGVLQKRSETKNAKTPIYVITNLGKEEDCEKAKELGAKDCFVKSRVPLKEVVDAVDAAMV